MLTPLSFPNTIAVTGDGESLLEHVVLSVLWLDIQPNNKSSEISIASSTDFFFKFLGFARGLMNSRISLKICLKAIEALHMELAILCYEGCPIFVMTYSWQNCDFPGHKQLKLIKQKLRSMSKYSEKAILAWHIRYVVSIVLQDYSCESCCY